MKRTVRMPDGSSLRISLPKPVWEGSQPYSTGVTLRALYVGPTTGRVVLGLHSIWEQSNRPGMVVGEYFRVVSEYDLPLLLDMFPEFAEFLEPVAKSVEL